MIKNILYLLIGLSTIFIVPLCFFLTEMYFPNISSNFINILNFIVTGIITTGAFIFGLLVVYFVFIYPLIFVFSKNENRKKLSYGILLVYTIPGILLSDSLNIYILLLFLFMTIISYILSEYSNKYNKLGEIIFIIGIYILIFGPIFLIIKPIFL